MAYIHLLCIRPVDGPIVNIRIHLGSIVSLLPSLFDLQSVQASPLASSKFFLLLWQEPCMLDRVLQQGGQGSRHALINSVQQCDGPEVPWPPPAAILGNQNCPSLYHPAGQVSIAIYCFPHRLLHSFRDSIKHFPPEGSYSIWPRSLPIGLLVDSNPPSQGPSVSPASATALRTFLPQSANAECPGV